MMAYKKAMQLDEENEEYIADFRHFRPRMPTHPRRGQGIPTLRKEARTQ